MANYTTQEIEKIFNEGKRFSDSHDHKSALAKFDECYKKSASLYGKEEPYTINVLAYVAVEYSNLGNHQKALSLFEECYEHEKKKFGACDKRTLSSLVWMAYSYKALGNHKMARKLYGTWYRGGKNTPGEGDSKFSRFGDLGSASNIVGRTVIVSIFLEDRNCSWNFKQDDDHKLYNSAYYGTKIATDWLKTQIARYGHESEFVLDWAKYNDLYYKLKFDGDILAGLMHGKSSNSAREIVDKNIDAKKLMVKYKANNILFQMIINAPYSEEVRSCAADYYEGCPLPYEISFILPQNAKKYPNKIKPAAIAHELLHSFGAPDLYDNNNPSEYGITKEYFEWAKKERTNDIMRTSYDITTGKPLFDKISNEITDITAYYIGLINRSETVDKWGFRDSHYV